MLKELIQEFLESHLTCFVVFMFAILMFVMVYTFVNEEPGNRSVIPIIIAIPPLR